MILKHQTMYQRTQNLRVYLNMHESGTVYICSTFNYIEIEHKYSNYTKYSLSYRKSERPTLVNNLTTFKNRKMSCSESPPQKTSLDCSSMQSESSPNSSDTNRIHANNVKQAHNYCAAITPIISLCGQPRSSYNV